MTAALKLISHADYLAWEETATSKSEYYRGQVYAMAGGTINHNRIARNVVTSLSARLPRRCEAFTSDMKVRVDAHDLDTYPDGMVICGKPQFFENRKDMITNPAVIFEVFSDSPQSDVRGKRFEFYRALDSFKDYVLLDQARVHIDHYHKLASDRWEWTILNQLDQSLHIHAIQVDLPVEALYDYVDWS